MAKLTAVNFDPFSDEPAFRQWYGGWAERAGINPDPDDPDHRYDYRSAFRAGATPEIDPEDGLYHWPSEYKADDHPRRFLEIGGRMVDTRNSGGRSLTPVEGDPFAPAKPSRRASAANPFGLDISTLGRDTQAIVDEAARHAGDQATSLRAAWPGMRQSMLTAARDTVAQAAPALKLATDPIGSLSEMAQGGDPAGRVARDVRDSIQASADAAGTERQAIRRELSPEAQALDREIADRYENEGFFSGLMHQIRNPSSIARLVTESAPATGAAILAGRFGPGGVMAATVPMGAGEAMAGARDEIMALDQSEAYDSPIYRQARESGATHEQGLEQLAEASRPLSGLIGAGAGAIPGAPGLNPVEQVLSRQASSSGARGVLGRLLDSRAGRAAREAIGEVPEEVGITVGSNIGQQAAGLDVDTFDGAEQAAGGALLAGGVMGALTPGSSRPSRSSPTEPGADLLGGENTISALTQALKQRMSQPDSVIASAADGADLMGGGNVRTDIAEALRAQAGRGQDVGTPMLEQGRQINADPMTASDPYESLPVETGRTWERDQANIALDARDATAARQIDRDMDRIERDSRLPVALQRASEADQVRAAQGLDESRPTAMQLAFGQARRTQEAAAPVSSSETESTVGTGDVLDFGTRTDGDLDAEYEAMPETDGGRRLDTDMVRNLSPEYRADPTRSADVHEAASGFTRRRFGRMLAAPVAKGRDAAVLFTAGGGGSGKSTAIDSVLGNNNADITLDGTLSNLVRARENVQAALDSGRSARIVYVYRSPENSVAGAIGRSIKTRRPVPISALTEAHSKAPEVVRALASEYNGDGRVEIIAINNDGARNDAHPIPVEEIPYVDRAEAESVFRNAVESARASGHLDESLYQAFTRSDAQVGPGHRRGDEDRGSAPDDEGPQGPERRVDGAGQQRPDGESERSAGQPDDALYQAFVGSSGPGGAAPTAVPTDRAGDGGRTKPPRRGEGQGAESEVAAPSVAPRPDQAGIDQESAQEQPKFSHVRPSGRSFRGADTAALNQHIGAIVSKWRGDVPKVEVVADGEGLPGWVKGDPGYREAEGFYDQRTGTTYLVAKNLPGFARARQVLAHEVIGHHGIEAIVGPELWSKIARDIDAMRRDPKHADLFADIDSRYAGSPPAILLRETVAVMAERGIGTSIIDRILAAVKRFLSEMGMANAMTEDRIRRAIIDAARHVQARPATPLAETAPEPAFSRGEPDALFSRPASSAERTSDGIDPDTLTQTTPKRSSVPGMDPFHDENRRFREQNTSLWQKAKQVLRRQLAPGGLLPESVFSEKIVRDSNFQAVEFDIRHCVRALEASVRKDYGTSMDGLSEVQMRKVGDALAGRIPADLPVETATAIVAMRQYIDVLSGEYLGILQGRIDALWDQAKRSGRDSDAARAINEVELYEKIKGNLGQYVHRSYRAFDDPGWFKKVPTQVINAARNYLADGYVEQGESIVEARRLADVALEQIKTGTAHDSMEAFISEGKLGAKDLSVLMRRKDVPTEIRGLLGEYVDPRVNFAKTATKMARLVWNQRFLSRVRELGAGSFLFEGTDRPPEARVQIAPEQSERYGPLDGLWTFPEVAQAFKDAVGKDQMGDVYRTVVRLNGMVKVGKTVLSPTTAMRNWQSALFFALANGHFDLTQMKKSWAAFREQVIGTASTGDLLYLRRLKELGVVYDTPYAGEMTRYIEDARFEDLFENHGRLLRGVGKIKQVAQGFYAFGDDFWKIIGFENEKASLIKAGIAPSEAETMAAERIRNTYPTYSLVGRGVRALSRFPLVGTFVSFPAEIIRTTANMLRQTASDLKSDNQGIRAIGIKRAIGMAMVSGMFYGLSALTRAMFGVDDEEENALRDLAPPWQKNSTFLYVGRGDDGRLRYFDLSFLDPYGYWKRPITAMLRDQPWEDAATSSLQDLLSPFLGQDIAFGAIMEVVTNERGTGGQVFNPNDTAIEQAGTIANHLRKALQPGFMGNAERIFQAARGQVREGSGQPFDMSTEMVALLGWRATLADPKTALHYRVFEFSDDLSAANRTLTRELRSLNTVSSRDIASAKASAERQQREAFRKMTRLVRAAMAAGMARHEVVQVLRQNNVSASNIGALLSGTPPPLRISPTSARNAVQQARIMRGPEHAQEVGRRFREAMTIAPGE